MVICALLDSHQLCFIRWQLYTVDKHLFLWLKAVLYLSSILWGVGRQAGAVRTSKTRHSAHHV